MEMAMRLSKLDPSMGQVCGDLWKQVRKHADQSTQSIQSVLGDKSETSGEKWQTSGEK